MNPIPSTHMAENVCILLLKTCIATYSTLPNKPTVADGYVECPDCHSSLHVGTVGIQNLYKWHRGSKKCLENKTKHESQQSLRKTQLAAHKFFKSRAPNVPPTVNAPQPILSTPISKVGEESCSHQDSHISPPGVTTCSNAIRLLAQFRSKIDKLPREVGEANEDHPLARFSGNPVGCVEDSADAWEQFDGPLNTVLQTSEEGLRALVRIGDKGLNGLHRLLDYLVNYHGIKGALLEMKLCRLMKAMDEV
jgi:hypothetical protein